MKSLLCYSDLLIHHTCFLKFELCHDNRSMQFFSSVTKNLYGSIRICSTTQRTSFKSQAWVAPSTWITSSSTITEAILQWIHWVLSLLAPTLIIFLLMTEEGSLYQNDNIWGSPKFWRFVPCVVKKQTRDNCILTVTLRKLVLVILDPLFIGHWISLGKFLCCFFAGFCVIPNFI